VSDVAVTHKVLTGTVNTVTPISLRAYARRRCISVTTVHRAVRDGRLTASVTWYGATPVIADAQLADQEWPAPVPRPGISLRAYARHRGVSAPTVSRAIRRGQLSQSVTWRDGIPSINDVAAADREWHGFERVRELEMSHD
jgi:hypothetical protein